MNDRDALLEERRLLEQEAEAAGVAPAELGWESEQPEPAGWALFGMFASAPAMEEKGDPTSEEKADKEVPPAAVAPGEGRPLDEAGIALGVPGMGAGQGRHSLHTLRQGRHTLESGAGGGPGVEMAETPACSANAEEATAITSGEALPDNGDDIRMQDEAPPGVPEAPASLNVRFSVLRGKEADLERQMVHVERLQVGYVALEDVACFVENRRCLDRDSVWSVCLDETEGFNPAHHELEIVLAIGWREAFISSKEFDNAVMVAIMANTVTMCLSAHTAPWSPHPDTFNLALSVTGHLFSGVFFIEMLLKIVCLKGVHVYLRSISNRFDCLVVMSSVIAFPMMFLSPDTEIPGENIPSRTNNNNNNHNNTVNTTQNSNPMHLIRRCQRPSDLPAVPGLARGENASENRFGPEAVGRSLRFTGPAGEYPRLYDAHHHRLCLLWDAIIRVEDETHRRSPAL